MSKRIVVTGMGVITSNALSTEEFTNALRSGRSGIKDITLFDASPYTFRRMGEIAGFRSSEVGLDRASQLALVAAHDAVTDAGEQWIMANRMRTGVVLGTTCGGISSHEQTMRKWRAGEPVSLDLIDEVPFHVMAGHIAHRYGLEGPVTTITIACASGANAVGFAADLIRAGHADTMLAGGSDTVSHFTFSGFSILRAMAMDACRPFDKNRTGIVLGEGAAVLVLEDAEQAIKRGAKIYAEILSYGFCTDAYHSTAPDPEGGGTVRSIQQALRKASLHPENIDYINAHGTGTRANDVMECNAYKMAFRNYACRIPVSSTKSMIGHTLGAAGAIELVATILSLKGQFVPPTINFVTPDPACDMDVVPNESRETRLQTAMSCNAGFAGNNTAVIVGNYPV